MAGLTNGGWVVTWSGHGDTGDGADLEIMLQQFNSNGVAVGSNTKVDAADGLDDRAPEITVLRDGGWVIAWDGQGAGGYEIFMQRYSSTGIANTNVDIVVSSTDANSDRYPKIASFPDGRWVVVWQDYTDQHIAYRLFDANGRGTGLEALAAGPLDITVTVWDFMGNSASNTASIVMDLNFDEGQPVLHWKLDTFSGQYTPEEVSGETNVTEAIGVIVPGQPAVAPDGGNSVVYVGAPGSYVSAGTLQTDGTYSAGTNASYQVLQNNWTISAWINLTEPQLDSGDHVIASSKSIGGDNKWWIFAVNGAQNELVFDFNSVRIGSGIYLPTETNLFVSISIDSSRTSFTDNNGHRFSAWDGTTWHFSDGLDRENIQLHDIELGSFSNGTRLFCGLLDDVRIYGETLSQDKVDKLSDADTDGDSTKDYLDTDDDDDGMNDGNEVIAGTNPKDNTSLFIVTDVSTVSSNVVFHWSSVSNHYYSIQGSSNLLSDTWQFIEGGIAGTPPYNAVTVTPLTVEAQFYRILIEVE